jgi:hypothetical protein
VRGRRQIEGNREDREAGDGRIEGKERGGQKGEGSRCKKKAGREGTKEE